MTRVTVSYIVQKLCEGGLEHSQLADDAAAYHQPDFIYVAA